MKTRIVLTLILALVLVLAACGQTQEGAEAPAESEQEVKTEEPAAEGTEESAAEAPALQTEAEGLAHLREQIEATGNEMGVAFLGTLSEGGQEAYDELVAENLEAYPFLGTLDWEKAAVNSGMEVYCVVPRDPNSSVTVTEWILDESDGYQGHAGQVLYESPTGEPVLVMGNESDILPNLKVTVAAPDGRSLSYSPCLSLCDGTLDRAAVEGIYDFTIYRDLPPQGIPNFTGDWAAFDVPDGDGQLYTCCAEFDQAGQVDYFYYQEPGVILERFTGTVDFNDDDTVTLDLYLTGGTYLENGAPAYGSLGTFRMEMPDEDTLYVTNLSGEPLLYGLEGQTMVFHRSVG